VHREPNLENEKKEKKINQQVEEDKDSASSNNEIDPNRILAIMRCCRRVYLPRSTFPYSTLRGNGRFCVRSFGKMRLEPQ
jgi:hypothetical protein